MNIFIAIRKIYQDLKNNNFNVDDIFYVCGSDDLPAPLEKDEETKAIEELAKGSREAKNLLVEHNLRLVVYIAEKFENTGAGIEDMVSIGTIGLMKAVNTFNSDKNIKLATYASRCIENEILMYLRKTTKIKREAWFERTPWSTPIPEIIL